MTRSNTYGTGKYAAHWTGDNWSNFFQLKLSISSVIRTNIYGIPMAGADICGFNGQTTAHLCARWYQLGSFYPFVRNHNSIDDHSQDPVTLGPIVVKSARNNLKLRYSLLKHYYSIFLRNNGTGTVFKSPFFEFYYDYHTLSDEVLQNQFLVGSELMVVPVVEPNTTQVVGYFPTKVDWFDFITGKLVVSKNNKNRSLVITNQLSDRVPIYMRGGSIIATQNSDNAQTVNDLDNSYSLKIALSGKSSIGKVVILGNLSDTEKVNEYCVEKNCLNEISALIKRKNRQIQIKSRVMDKDNCEDMINNGIIGNSFKFIELMLKDVKSFESIFEGKIKIKNSNIGEKVEIALFKKSDNLVIVELPHEISLLKNNELIINY